MMTRDNSQPLKFTFILFLVLLFTVGISASSCGNGDTGKKTAQKSESGAKLPPGTSREDLESSTYTGVEEAQNQEKEPAETKEAEKTGDETAPQTPRTGADLAGARFTIVEASRKDTNKDAVQTGQREISGDYLEVELEIQNIGDDLADLSQYSFRLESPGIDADSYEDYYGQVYTYGKYVSEDTISGVLMDYSDLQAAAYVMKMGEVVDKVFLFFDLNPQNIARNDQVTKENTKLIIYKSRGSDYGEKVEIGLAGYPD